MGADKLFFKRARIMKESIEADLQDEIDNLDETVRSLDETVKLIAKRHIRALNKGVVIDTSDLLDWDEYEDYALTLLIDNDPKIPTFKEYLGSFGSGSTPLSEPDQKNLLMMMQALYINGDLEMTLPLGNPLHEQGEVAAICKQIFEWDTEADMINGIIEKFAEWGESFPPAEKAMIDDLRKSNAELLKW